MPHDFSSDVIAAMNDRIQRLERANRRLAWLSASCVACVLMLVAAGAMPAQVAEKIEAKQFVLRSGDGKVIAELGEDEIYKKPYLHLFERDGSVRLAAGLSGLTICKPSADPRVTTTGRIILSLDPDGERSLLFRDDQGRSRLQVGLTKEQVPNLTLWDKNLAPRINLSVDQKTDAPITSINEVRP